VSKLDAEDNFEIQLSFSNAGPWILVERVKSPLLFPVLKKAREWTKQLGSTLLLARVIRNGNVEIATILRRTFE